VVPYDARSGPGAALEPVHGEEVRSSPHYPGGYRPHVMHGGDLHSHRQTVLGALLEHGYQLGQVLYAVYVVMRVRRQGVRAAGYHAGLGDHGGDLFARQMPAVAGLGPLPDLDLHRRHFLQVFGLDAEAAGGHLRAYVVGVLVEVRMQPALSAAGHDVQLLGGHEQRLLRVVGYGAERDMPEHQGHVHSDQRGVVLPDHHLAVADLQPARPPAQIGHGLHRLP